MSCPSWRLWCCLVFMFFVGMTVTQLPPFSWFLNSYFTHEYEIGEMRKDKKNQQTIPEKECSALLTCSSSAKSKVWSEYFKTEFNTNTMEQSPTSESNSSSASQEISQILYNLQVHYHIHETLSLLCVLSHVNPPYPCAHVCSPWVPHALPISSFWVWWGGQIIRLFIMSF
jgi:hypothetical protein